MTEESTGALVEKAKIRYKGLDPNDEMKVFSMQQYLQVGYDAAEKVCDELVRIGFFTLNDDDGSFSYSRSV